MLTKRKIDDVTWIDLESPTKEEVQILIDEYMVHPLAAEELLSRTMRPKVDLFDEHLYLILHFPTVIHPVDNHYEQEVDFIIGKDFLITAHYQPIKTLKEFADNPEIADIIKERERYNADAGILFFKMIQRMYALATQDLDSITRSMKHIEEQIFGGHEHSMVKAISKTRRKLLDFRIATRPHREVLESLKEVGEDFFGEGFSYHLNAISAEYYKVYTIFENNSETLAELRETNNSLLSTKTNDTMKTLTILAFVTFPLSLVASIFGMNTNILPIVGHPQDFWIIVGGMFIATIGFFAFFRFKKWL